LPRVRVGPISPLNLGEFEDDNTKQTLLKFRAKFRLYDSTLNTLIGTVSYLLERFESEPIAKATILCLMVRVIQTIQSIKILALKGYYYDAAILERSLIETLGLCSYFALNEEEAKKWWERKKLNVSYIRLTDSISQLLRATKANEKPIPDAKPIYGWLSRFVHSEPSAIVFSFIERDQEANETSLNLAPRLVEKSVEQIGNYGALALTILVVAFEKKIPNRKQERIFRLLVTVLRLGRARDDEDKRAKKKNKPNHQRNTKQKQCYTRACYAAHQKRKEKVHNSHSP
jgi:hypothetical protein